jgi:hypothetical protein
MTEIPNMKPVKSSNVEAIGHNPHTLELHVRFKNGGHYVYQGVLPEHHLTLLQAESIGKHIAAHIKGKYNHRRLP